MTQKELEDLIIHHQHLYYSGTPVVEDWEFDQLWDELAAEYPNSELLKKVGDEGEIDGDKCKHIIRMGSQEKITTEEQLKDWIRLKKIQFPIIAQLKYDGISVELVYDSNGDFKRAVTRGDGSVGKLITENVAKMNGVPKHINVDIFIEEQDEYAIRGEIMLPLSNVDKLVNVDEVTNVRNMASGIANQKNSSDNLNLLDIVCYDVNDDAEYEITKIQILRECGFITPQYNKLCLTTGEVLSFIEQIKTERKTLDYQTDGVVLKQNEIPQDGDFSKARPDWQRAFKYPVEEAITQLEGIEFSRNGYNFTPVALLKPVKINDTTVSRASLANVGEMKRLGVLMPCTVNVSKRGEIIPHVESVTGFIVGVSHEIELPETCPFCGEPLEVTDTSIKCVNEACITHSEHRIRKWVDTVGALGFGDSLLIYLIHECHFESIMDLYCNDNVNYAIEHTNLKKNVQKAFADLWARSRNLNLWDFVAGFDLDGIGSRVIKTIVDAGYDTLEKLCQVNYEELVNIQGIGEFRAKVFVEKTAYLSDEMKAVLATNRVTIKPVKEVAKSLTFCITGALSSPRKEIEQLIESKGHKLASSVTKNVNYLVTNNPNSGSSKNEKALSLGIPILNEEEFLRIING